MLGDAQRRVAEANEMAAAELAARMSAQEQGRAMLEKAKLAAADGQSLFLEKLSRLWTDYLYDLYDLYDLYYRYYLYNLYDLYDLYYRYDL